MEFTFERYGALLDELTSAGYAFTGYERSLADGEAILRHDVDWSPEKACRMAEIEADRGVTATYFVLVTSPFYNVHFGEIRDCLHRIESLGHTVALHFSTHQYWDAEPPGEELRRRVDEEQSVLGTVTREMGDAVAFHIPPSWTLDRSFDGITSAYEPRFFSEIAYRADSGQRWRDEHPFDGGIPDRLQLLTHPGLWGETDASFEARLREQEGQRFDATREFLASEFLGEGSA
ncbi:polysaccharide deacetylase family protein [Halegenticoccus soli]|uniref:hypothetical protein n=1 Tax=Halegenticoccus soli TaxID=1985678 RepID=UPI00117B20F4|nr:hypothetical protein [Halegenticoccus soli]